MILEALSLGLSTGFFCLGFCAPVLMGLLISEERKTWRHTAWSFVLFLSGRLVAYLLFGVLSFFVGRALGGTHLVGELLLPAADLGLGALMVAYSLGANFPHWGVCRVTHKWLGGERMLLAAGFFTGMNICPPFLLAVGAAMRTGSLLASVGFFLVFFVATSLYLMPLLFSGLAARSKDIRSAARVFCGLAGLWFVGSGVRLLFFG